MTQSSLQHEASVPQIPSSTENSPPELVSQIPEAAGSNSGETLEPASHSSQRSLQKRPADEVKPIEVGILLQTIESQLELQKTFKKQLEMAKAQVELLQQAMTGVAEKEKEVKPAATPSNPRKVNIKWDPQEVERWQRETLPTNEKLYKMLKLFTVMDKSGIFYASRKFTRIAFPCTNGPGVDEIQWPQKAGTKQGEFLERIKRSWPQDLVEGDQFGTAQWLGGVTYPDRSG
jgi:hypothetical protein